MTVLAKVNANTLCNLDVADNALRRARGLLGRDSVDGALLLRPCSSVHSFRMRFTIDVAFLDKQLRVRDIVRLRPGRMTRPRRAHAVLEAADGAFARWGLVIGDELEIREGVASDA